MRNIYIRFVVNQFNDGETDYQKGLFTAIVHLEQQNLLFDYEQNLVTDLQEWFDKNQPNPTLPKYDSVKGRRVAIFWFKSHAAACIKRMWELVAILEVHEIQVELLQTKRPGYIVYEDEHQIAAVPFAETFG